jgi:hypothetical protein
VAARHLVVALGISLIMGFGCEHAPAEDGQDDRFVPGGKADGEDSTFRRTVVFLQAATKPGQHMFVRGGLDHQLAAARLGKQCTTTNTECAIPITHLNLRNPSTTAWKTGDGLLDWYGAEPLQTGRYNGAPARGTPLDWSTNYWPAWFGQARTVADDGYGVEPLNMYGADYWMLDVQMDCSRALTVDGASWFELKAYVANGAGWEPEIHQPGAPFASKNHVAQCGKVNVFRFGENRALHLPIEVRTDPYVVGAGDIAYAGAAMDQTAALLDELAPPAAFVFTAGDNAQGPATDVVGKALEYTLYFEPSWGRFRPQLRPAMGNHDFMAAQGAAYYDYFGDGVGERGKGYYSYDVGPNWHAVVLNSNNRKVSVPLQEELDWLASDLAEAQGKHVFAYWHHPRFSSGEHANNDVVRPYWELLTAAGAEFVISGHDHDYERFAPQLADGRRDDAGMRQFVVGTGGMGLRGYGSIRPNSEVRDADTWGVIKIVLHDSWYEWLFLPVAGGTFFDSGATPCHQP